jgi:Protein of unknown function (DUF998)
MIVAGVIALLALAATVASLAYLHLAPTGLSPVRNAVSQYGITPYRAGYRAATIAFGVAGAALAVGIGRAVSGHGSGIVVLLLVIFALARGVISWFPMDSPGSELTATGRRHGLLAIAAFGSLTIAAFRLARLLSREVEWHSLAGASAALGIVMVVCLVAMGLSRALPAVRRSFGAIERGFYLAAIGWATLFAYACAANPR